MENTQIKLTEIFNSIFSEIENQSGKKIKTKKFSNGYYLFEFGSDTVCNFTVEGAKNWLFGIWAIPQEDDSINVYLFGEHKYYLNKFKPTQTKISQDCKIKNRGELKNLIYNLGDTISEISLICNYPIIGYIKTYWNTCSQNPIKWYIKNWIFYEIKKPIIDWKRNQLNNMLAIVYKYYSKLRWRKYLNISIIDSRKNGFEVWPRFEFKVEFKKDVSESDLCRIYHQINKLKFYNSNCQIACYKYGARRSFYVSSDKN